ncbi:MAG: Nitrincola phage [Bacteroidota bacterium]|jgi:hypothetical protein
MSTITAQIQLRRDTSANWTSNNPILLDGEMALSTDVLYSGTDQPRYKIGNGVDTWLNLDYVPEGGAGYPENLYLTVVNKTGDNLLASGYKVLKVQTAQGQRLAVDYALADSDANSADTIGVVYENIDNNQSGRIVVIGELTGLNTTGSLQGETWADGDLLFLSPFVDGGITNVRPTAPNHGVIIGYVVYSHANNGKIYCKIDNGYEIGELHNCYLPTPSNNQGIFWSSGTTRYENKSLSDLETSFVQSIFHASNVNPADATNYYVGVADAPSTTSKDASIIIPVTGNIKSIGISSVIYTTLGTAENSTFSVRVLSGGINGTAIETLLTNTYKLNATYNSTILTGLNISVNAGDAIEIKWLTPTWVTNPTGVRLKFNLFIR